MGKMEVNVDNRAGPGTKVFVVLLVLLVLLTAGLCYMTDKVSVVKTELKACRNECAQLTDAAENWQDTAQMYQVRWQNGTRTWAAQAQTVYSNKANIRNVVQGAGTLKSLGVKSKDVESVANCNTETRDSVKMNISTDMGGINAVWCDTWTNISAKIGQDMAAELQYSIRDSFTLVNYVNYKRFLFWKWGRKDEYILTARNPHTRILGLKVVKVVKNFD